jgi:ATP-dependent protease HslVU (ClpYQ) peptidase subunit
MTCVIGLVHKGRVYLGADSSSVQGWTRRVTMLRKIFRLGPFLVGYTTSFRMGQLLEHELRVPDPKPGQSDLGYMVANFAESARALLKDRGFSKVEANAETGGQFLVAYRGHLYSIQSDFQVGEMAGGLDAIGTGAEPALGAMAALRSRPPASRIRRSLEIAAEFNMGVCPPFYVRSAGS